jgi:hypothetical protein
MDSTQIASNILDMSRLQLLVQGLLRMQRPLSEAEQHSYQEWLGAYVEGSPGQYVYRVKGKEATLAHTQADDQLNAHKVELIQTGIRGKAPAADKLSLSQFAFTTTQKGKPLTIACPNGQEIELQPGCTTGHIARFDPHFCQTCPFAVQDRCRAKPGKKDPAFKLSFTQQEVNWARRRQRFESSRQAGKNPRAAIEAVIRAGKLFA